MSAAEDMRLFEAVKKDDFKAYERLFRSYYQGLYGFAYTYLRDQVPAEEMAQEVLLYLWEKRLDISIKTTLKTYLYSAIKNKCLNYIKYELPRNQQLEESHLAFMTTNPEEDHEPDTRIKTYIQQAISQLPKKCQQIFVLSRYGGLTYEEIADEMEISVKTVENQMTIALRKLRESLRPVYERMKKE